MRVVRRLALRDATENGESGASVCKPGQRSRGCAARFLFFLQRVWRSQPREMGWQWMVRKGSGSSGSRRVFGEAIGERRGGVSRTAQVHAPSCSDQALLSTNLPEAHRNQACGEPPLAGLLLRHRSLPSHALSACHRLDRVRFLHRHVVQWTSSKGAGLPLSCRGKSS